MAADSKKPGPQTSPDPDTASPPEPDQAAPKPAPKLRADKPAQALHSQWAQDDANRTARQREADRDRWRDV